MIRKDYECVKCGSTENSLRYIKEIDEMEVSCDSCSYSWLRPCLDAEVKTKEEDK